jgi:hypothetical protein
MTLATFLVCFALMMARLTAAGHPRLVSSAASTLVGTGSPPGSVRTRSSGGSVAPAVPTPAAVAERSSAPAIITRASGAGGTVRLGDD